MLKGLLLYVLFPSVCLLLFTQQIASAVRASEAAAFLILFAASTGVCLNWTAYTVIHRKRPSLLVYAYGALCLLLLVIIEYEALPGSLGLASTLAVIGGCLALAFMFLLSFWLSRRRSRPAHVFAVGLWIMIGLISFFMAYQVVRDFETRNVTWDTWITIAILVAVIPAAFSRRILASFRRNMFRRRATGLATGNIVQIVGETYLDRDEDLATDYYVRVQYIVDDASYETRVGIAKRIWRKYGRKAFLGQEISVHYNPENPADSFADRIDKHFFDRRGSDSEDPETAVST